jgi:hypothetical protein
VKTIRAIVTFDVISKPEETMTEVVFSGVKEALLGTAHENRLSVIASALSVERELEAIILHYFLGESHDRRDAFESLILRSDWCSFSAKLRLVMHIVEEQSLLQDSERNAFEKLLRKVMSFRNAFAHGRMHGDTEKRVFLSYFESKPREVQLTDDYLTRIELTLHEASHATTKLLHKLEAIKTSGNGS